MKNRTVTPYWIALKPLFRRYGVCLRSEPTEIQIQQVIKKWLSTHEVNQEPLSCHKGFGIDIVDFEVRVNGFFVGIEAKGYSNQGCNITRALDQLKRYSKLYDYVFLIVHCSGLKTEFEKILPFTSTMIKKKLKILKIAEIDTLLQKYPFSKGTLTTGEPQ